ncbi:hypothetical protein POTOM_055117 [Populus tomentosa]|uniref:Uncharacterized protein n=1 Tax=Populus tomentosa TaxID=118781 RepID=A0A8X7XWS4_POPTO|nr:hypothetical protein POTOM_055117 [Populus tomentosa]
MTCDDRAPLRLLTPGAEEKTQLLLGRWGRDMARQATGTSCRCRGETGHNTVVEGYSVEAKAAKACIVVMLIFGVAVAALEGRLAEGENGGLLMGGKGWLAEGENGGLLMGGRGDSVWPERYP